MYLQRTAGNLKTLASITPDAGAAPGAVATSSDGAAVASRTHYRLPRLPDEVRAQMTADVDHIVRILKKGTPDSGDQTRLLELVRGNARRDDVREAGDRHTPMLDHFLQLLKARAFSRSSFRSLWQDQYSIVYDTLWYELRGYWLEEFKRIVEHSETQRTAGPEAPDTENGAALIAKQEAMGMWGMLKGMGTGLVGVAGPKAAQAMSAQFDEAARILFGHEWDSSEPLVAGMNAAQIGTAGGDVIWQLVTFARAAGAGSATKVMAIANKLKTLMAVGSGLQGVAMAASGIAQVIESRQERGLPITVRALLDDNDFLDQVVMLASSVIGTALAAKGTPSNAQQALTRARIGMLLGKLQVVSSLKRLADIAATTASDKDKELQYGQVLSGLIPQLVSLGIDAHGHAQARRDAKATAPAGGQQGSPKQDAVPPPTPAADVEQPATRPVAPVPSQPPVVAAPAGTAEPAVAAKPPKPVPVRRPPTPGEPEVLLDRTRELQPLEREALKHMQAVADTAPAARPVARAANPAAAAGRTVTPSDVPPAHVIDFLERQKQAKLPAEQPRLQLEVSPQPLVSRSEPSQGAVEMSMTGQPSTSPKRSPRPPPSEPARPASGEPATRKRLDLGKIKTVAPEEAKAWSEKVPAKNDMHFSDVDTTDVDLANVGPKSRLESETQPQDLVRVKLARGAGKNRYKFEAFPDDPNARPLSKARRKELAKDFLVLPEDQARNLGFVKQGEDFTRLGAGGERLNRAMEVLDVNARGRVKLEGGKPVLAEPFVLRKDGKQVMSTQAHEDGHPVAGRASSKPTKKSQKKAIESNITPSLQEPDSLKFLVAKDELILKLAGNANAPGADHITFDRKTGHVYLNDATTPTQPKKKKATHKQWRKDFEAAFPVNKAGQRDFGFDPATNAAINKALADNKVFARTLRPASEKQQVHGQTRTVDKVMPHEDDPKGLRVYTTEFDETKPVKGGRGSR